MTAIKPSIGTRVREHREFARLTQEQLCELCGFSRNTIWRIENDRGNFAVAHLQAIADRLDIPITTFFEPKYKTPFRRPPPPPPHPFQEIEDELATIDSTDLSEKPIID